MSEKTKYVYFFGAGATEGNAGMKNILGGKGANLAEMASLGLPVPQGSFEVHLSDVRSLNHWVNAWQCVCDDVVATFERISLVEVFWDINDEYVVSSVFSNFHFP